MRAGHLALKYWDDDAHAEINGRMDVAEATGEAVTEEEAATEDEATGGEGAIEE